MKSVLFGTLAGSPGTTGNSLDAGITWASPVFAGSAVIPAAGNITNFRIILSVAPGAGNSRTFTVRLNGVGTSLAITISGTDTSGTGAGPLSVTPGQVIAVRSTSSGSPAATAVRWSSLFEGSIGNQSMLLGGNRERVYQRQFNYLYPPWCSKCARWYRESI